MSPTESDALAEQVGRIADEFQDRLRRGETPTVEEYAAAHPPLAAVLRGVLPLVGATDAMPPAAAPPVPERLGEYRILREVGRGGMGVVYEAVQEPLGRRVALKVLPAAVQIQPGYLERFRREARAAARLHHTNIVPVFGVGSAGGVQYYAMQFIEGTSLAEVVSRAATDPANAATWGQQAANALAYAHAHGVLHRDVKPANLLLDASGTVWIADFGLAKLAGGDDLTATGDFLGTLRYSAPECLRGPADARSDVYSLGATLYELLTGRPAVDAGARDQLVRQIAEDEPPPPRRVNPAVPRDLETIVLKALVKDPGRRYQSAAELAEDLRRFLADEPVRARRLSPVGRAWRWCRRNPGLATATTAVAVLVLTVAAVASVAALLLREERNATRDQLGQTEAARRDSQLRLLDARLSEARARRWSGRVGQRFEALAALTDAAHIARELDLGEPHLRQLRDEAIADLALADVRPAKEWTGNPTGLDSGFAFDAGLGRYARIEPEGGITVRRVADDAELARLVGPSKEVGITGFSPDGTFLSAAYAAPTAGQRETFLVWDWQRRAVVFRPPFTDWTCATFTPDGRQMAVGRSDGTLAVFDLPGGAEVKWLDLKLALAASADVTFHPRGSLMAVVSRGLGEVRVYDAAAGTLVQRLPHRADSWTTAWHPDGTLLAVAAGKDVHLWDTATWRPHKVLQGHQGRVVDVSFADGGDALVSQSWDGKGRRLWDPWTGRLLLSISCGGGRQPSWDERGLVSGGGTKMLRLWDVALGREYRTMPGPRIGNGNDGAISPDGRWVAATADDGVRLWDLARGTGAAHLPAGQTVGLAFHPSGRELFTCNPSGLYRWPIRQTDDRLRIGPPARIPVPDWVLPLQRIAFDAAGRTLAVGGGNGGTVLDLANPSGPVPRLNHRFVTFVAISPDGRWVALGTWNGWGVKVWDARTGQPACDTLLTDEPIASVAFSPDSRLLATGSHSGVRFWPVGSWQPCRHVSTEQAQGFHGRPFSPDGTLLAGPGAAGGVQLFDPAGGPPLASLQVPHDDLLNWTSWTPDGSRLVVSAAGRVRVWDLRRVRTRLAAMGLDWDRPPYPPAAAETPPVRVEVDPGDLGPAPQKK